MCGGGPVESEFDVAVVIIVRNEASKNFNSIVQGKIVTPLVSHMKMLWCFVVTERFLITPSPRPFTVHLTLKEAFTF